MKIIYNLSKGTDSFKVYSTYINGKWEWQRDLLEHLQTDDFLG